jgi:hypothetical protein
MRHLASLLAVLGAACTSVAPPPPPLAPSPTSLAPLAAPTPTQIFPCPELPQAAGQLLEPSLDEISGIVESAAQPGVFFVHNDSGDSPRFFAIDLQGRVLAIFTLPSVPLMIDAEDIAAGPGPSGKRYLYLGDTGNNFASMGLGIPRRKAVLYRIPEPELPPSARSLSRPLDEATPIVLTFPDGARDVEAFFVDPRSGDLFLISKQSDGQSQLLTASSAQLGAGGGLLRLAGRLVFGKPPLAGSTMPTAASISPDGSRIVVRTYSSVFGFARAADESVPSALARPPRSLAAPDEAQGESIALTDQGRAFVTVSEGVRPRIFCGGWPQ